MVEFGDKAQCKNCPGEIELAMPPGLKVAWFHVGLDSRRRVSYRLVCPRPYNQPIAEPVD